MTPTFDDPTLKRLRRANPIGEPPADLADRPAARTLRSSIVQLEQDGPTPVARRSRRRRQRGLALALVGAVAVAGVAYGAVRWSEDDLPAAGSGRDAFVLPETTLLPGGYTSTRAPCMPICRSARRSAFRRAPPTSRRSTGTSPPGARVRSCPREPR